MLADSGHPQAKQLLEEFVSGILGQPVDVLTVLTQEERTMLFRHLSRSDELGRQYSAGERLVWTLSELDAAARERLPQPHLDQFVLRVRSRLPAKAGAYKTCWPENRPFALCLSHDMDHVTSFTARERWRRLGRVVQEGKAGTRETLRLLTHAAKGTIGDCLRKRILRRRDRFDNVGEWLKLEADLGFKSSLFFFAQNVRPYHRSDCAYSSSDPVQFDGNATTVGKMMLEITGRGWDVGVHGSIASATEPDVLTGQKREIETVTGVPVLTTRQHYLQYDIRRTPAMQSGAGILADGTQGFNDTVGFRAGTSFPYRVWDWSANTLLPLWQIPLHIQDGPLMRASATANQAVARCVQLMDQVERVGGCLGLLFHPQHLATDLGFTIYRMVLQEAHRRNAWGCTLKEVATHFRDHIHQLQIPDKVIVQ